jgi:hypothetical protein
MQFKEIVKNSKKFATINDVVNNLDLIADIVKEDVLKIAVSKKIYFDDFNFTYSKSVEILKKQVKKTHLKAIKKLFQFIDIEDALKWIISRILNNSINITTNKKYKLFCKPIFLEFNEKIEIESDCNIIIELLDLERVDTNTIKKGLKKVWNEAKYDSDFDYQDFEELCCKFGFNAREVVGSHALAQPKLSKYQVANKYFQLELLF